MTEIALRQVRVMMAQDARSFLQALEQVFIAANARAVMLAGDKATSPLASEFIKNLKELQADAIAFSDQIAAVAVRIAPD